AGRGVPRVGRDRVRGCEAERGGGRAVDEGAVGACRAGRVGSRTDFESESEVEIMSEVSRKAGSEEHVPVGRTTRRDFLIRTAAAAGVGALTGLGAGEARGESRGTWRGPIPRAAERAPLRPDEPVRIGVIGTGGMGTEHCRAFLRLAGDGRADVELVAIADVCQPRMENALRRILDLEAGAKSSIAAYSDYRR